MYAGRGAGRSVRVEKQRVLLIDVPPDYTPIRCATSCRSFLTPGPVSASACQCSHEVVKVLVAMGKDRFVADW
jgi:hypothetical protein